MKYTKEQLHNFLRESNAIEGVYDNLSLYDAINAWEYLIAQDVLTLDVIKKTHAILMKNQPLADHEKGQFRTVPVWIGRSEGLHYSKIEPFLLMQFCFETMRASPPPDALALHVVYEKVHPFVDGNGRTGRLFLNWTRVKRNDEPLIIFTEKDRYKYYELFQ